MNCTTDNCTGLCEENEFTCFNGECIDMSYVCDGINDCGDNSDEVNCSKYSTSRNVTQLLIG